jgi:hypothetical protein
MIRMTEIIATRPNDREGFPSQSFETPTGRLVASFATLGCDPPPLKWSDLRYVFDIKEDRNGKEAIQA